MLKWWQQAIFYQIYPRSFADGNGDGIGDFKGIIAKLDYLKDLGIDALWLSPHYPSPQLDVGYDISNYVDVNPEYGTLGEFITFLAQAHQRGIRVILDLVLNHTSHEHPWFIESASSRDNPKRDWYIWRDGKDGAPPNNWASPFDNSAWEWDEITGQYYYHHFFKWQPDLNWRNPEVKKAMFDAVRFWLDLGVDGFRLDAISTIYEDPLLRDHECPYTFPELIRKVVPFYFGETTPAMQEQAEEIFKQYELIFQYQINQPGVHELMQELRALVDEYPDRVLVGETDDVAFYGDGTNELQMLFNFPLMEAGKLTAEMVRKNQSERLPLIPFGAWAANTLNNHDGTRLMSRYADGKHDWEYARLGLAIILTLKGTPFLYNGEEIGMSNLLLDNLDDFRDLVGLHYYHLMVDAQAMPAEEAAKMAARITRDVCRTPMQWSNQPNAGFSPEGVKTWLPVNPNYADGINVSDQLSDPASHLNFYKQLIALRKSAPALMDGDYCPLLENNPDVCAFTRTSASTSQTCLVLLNMSENFHHLNLNELAKGVKKLYSSIEGKQTEISLNAIQLNAFEIFIGELIH